MKSIGLVIHDLSANWAFNLSHRRSLLPWLKRECRRNRFFGWRRWIVKIPKLGYCGNSERQSCPASLITIKPDLY